MTKDCLGGMLFTTTNSSGALPPVIHQTSPPPPHTSQLHNNSYQHQYHNTSYSWDRRYNELVEYMAEHGNCDVPQKYETNPRLGYWVATQRTQHKYHIEGKQSSLNNEKIERLESIGFNWRVRNRSPKRKIDDLAEALVDEIRLDLPNNEFMNTLDDDQEEPTKKKTKISRPSKTWTEHN